MKKTLYLMRHGQTLFNLRRKIQGWCDSPLTETGKAQARIAGEYFRKNNITFDHAYSSTSERCCDTLELVTDMPYTRVKGLKECNFGLMEGESEDLNPKHPYGEFFKAYGGESDVEVDRRITATITEIMEKPDHHTVLCVSHAGASLHFLFQWTDPKTVDAKKISQNCSIMKFEYEDGRFTPVGFTVHDFSSLTKEPFKNNF